MDGREGGKLEMRTLWIAALISESVSSLTSEKSTPRISAAKVGCSACTEMRLNLGVSPIVILPGYSGGGISGPLDMLLKASQGGQGREVGVSEALMPKAYILREAREQR